MAITDNNRDLYIRRLQREVSALQAIGVTGPAGPAGPTGPVGPAGSSSSSSSSTSLPATSVTVVPRGDLIGTDAQAVFEELSNKKVNRAGDTMTGALVVDSTLTATGAITGSNLSGTNTGDQTITLTGDVTGTGTGSFAATIANAAVTLPKMAALAADSILGMDLKGYTVGKVLVEEAVDFTNELYVGVTMDRGEGEPVAMVSEQGGVNI